MPRQYTCQQCGNDFTPKVPKNPNKYCSIECYAAARRRPWQERFWEKVQRAGADECWLWTGSTTSGGYGKFDRRNGKYEPRSETTVHRIAYELMVGTIPEGHEIHHTCWNTLCVNPAHLEAVTPAEHGKYGRRPYKKRKKTHCKHGHEFTPENTYVDRHGHRRCRECHRFRQSGFPTRQRAYGPVRRRKS